MLNRPHVVGSVAISVDGAIDDRSSERPTLSNDKDWQEIDKLRAENDAILVGAGTLRADNPSLSIRSEDLRQQRIAAGQEPCLVKVTITRDGNLDPKLKFFSAGAADKLVYCPNRTVSSLEESLRGLATVIGCPGENVDPQFVLADLFERGVKKLLIEGGEKIHTMFLERNLVDELRVAIAPFFVGDPHAPRFVGQGVFPYSRNARMHLAAIEQIGDMAVLKYKLQTGDLTDGRD